MFPMESTQFWGADKKLFCLRNCAGFKSGENNLKFNFKSMMFLEMLYFILSPPSMNSNFHINSNRLPSAPKGCIRGRRPLQHTPGLRDMPWRTGTVHLYWFYHDFSWLALGKLQSQDRIFSRQRVDYSGMSPQGLPFPCWQKSWGLMQEPNNSPFPSKCGWMCLAHPWAQLTWTIRPNTLRRRVHLVLLSY